MLVYRVNVKLDNTSGTVDVSFSNQEELLNSMRELDEMGFTYDSPSQFPADNRRLCPVHKVELKESKRKPGYLYCPEKEGERFCQYEEKK